MHWSFIIRIFQLLFAFLVLALAAAAIGEFGSGSNSLNFLLFCGIWAILSLVYLVVTPSKFPQIHHQFIACGVEFLCMIFFFAGFIAVAADIGNINCNILDDETFFGHNLKTGCECTKAAIAFGAFSWVLWLVTLALVVREVYLEHSGNPSAQGPGVGVGNKDVSLDEPGRHPMSEPVV